MIMDHQKIATVKYQKQIAKICHNLPKIGNISNICMCLIFNDLSRFFLSNMPDWAQDYHKIGGSRGDNVFYPEYYKNNDYFFPRESQYDHIQQQLVKIEEEKYNYFDTYSILRNSFECKIIFLCLHNKPINNIKDFYKQTINAFEDFAINFIIKTQDIIKEYNPKFSEILLLNNYEYLSLIIKKNIR